MIILHSYLNLLSNLVTVLIPVIFVEKIMSLQINTELNRTGEMNTAFEVIYMVTAITKEMLIRVILYGVSVGYLWQ